MERGNLASGTCPRIGIIWEGAIAVCTDTKRFAKLAAKQRFNEGLSYWQPVELVVRKLLWLYHKKSVNLEVITFLPIEDGDFEAELGLWLDRQGIPVYGIMQTTPEWLARQIAYMPDLVKIYDPAPERWAMYGGKGEYLDKVEQLGAWNG
jgi:hypothetical protein